MILTLALASLPALAADAAKEIPTPRVGAQVYSHLKYDLTDGNAGCSEFGIDRAFLVPQGQITQQIGAKVTIDADLPRGLVGFDATTGTATTDTKMRVFLKNAWVEGKLPAGIKVRAGIVDTGWVAFGEQFCGIRYITRQLADVGKLDSAADFGVNVQGNEARGSSTGTSGSTMARAMLPRRSTAERRSRPVWPWTRWPPEGR